MTPPLDGPTPGSWADFINALIKDADREYLERTEPPLPVPPPTPEEARAARARFFRFVGGGAVDPAPAPYALTPIGRKALESL